MIVDCHTHLSTSSDLSPYPATRGTESEGAQDASECLAAQETVDKCVVLAAHGQSAEENNDEVAEFVAKYPEKMVGFGFVDPTKSEFSTKSLSKLKNKQGLKGLVLYCSACDFHPAHSKAMVLYEKAQELGLPVFFHNTPDMAADTALQYSQPYLLDEIARKFGNLKIIIGNMGLPFVDQTLSMVAKNANVYADLTLKPKRTWQLYTAVISSYEHGILDKLLFGSGFPQGTPGESIEALLGFNKHIGEANLPAVPRGELRKIIERNTIELLGIE